MQRNRYRADKSNPGLIDGKPRTWVDHLIARVDVGHHGIGDRWLRPGGNDNLLGVDLEAAGFQNMASNTLPQGQDALGIRVVGVTCPDVLDGNLIDVLRAVEIRLSEVELDHPHTHLLTPPDVVPNFECVFRSEIFNSFRIKIHFWPLPISSEKKSLFVP